MWKRIYIGETKKPTKERIREHEMAVCNRNHLSLVFKHCEENDHTMNFDEYNVLNQNKNTKSRKLLESFHTYSNSNSMNRSMHFSEIYRPTIKKIIKNSWFNIEYFHVLTYIYLNMSIIIYMYKLSNSFLVLAQIYGMWFYLYFTYWCKSNHNTFGIW